MQFRLQAWRPVALLIGVIMTIVNSWGLYEYALKLEGGKLSYQVVGYATVAICVALFPPIAEWLYKQGEVFKAGLLCLVAIPLAAGCIFFSAAERIHSAREARAAEDRAAYSTSMRAEEDLKVAKAKLTSIERAEAKAKSTPPTDCKSECRTTLEQAKTIRKEVAEAETVLTEKQSKVTLASAWRAPDWLVPVTLDFIGFIAIWIALSGSWMARNVTEVRIITGGKSDEKNGTSSQKTSQGTMTSLVEHKRA